VAAITDFKVFATRTHPAAQKVLVDGACGWRRHSLPVQIAEILRAEVHCRVQHEECRHGRSIGADHVIDYLREKFHAERAPLRPDPGANAIIRFSTQACADQDGIYVISEVFCLKISKVCYWHRYCHGWKHQSVFLYSEHKPPLIGFSEDLLEPENLLPVIR